MTTPPGRMFTPDDAVASRRAARLRELDLGQHPEPAFDAFARSLADSAGARFAMVNFLREDTQYFAGLYAPSLAGDTAAPGDHARIMTLDQGWCPLVVHHGRARALGNVYDYPRSWGNPVIGQLGIRAYLGAPVLDEDGTALGTVCTVDTRTRQWDDDEGLAFIKEMAADLTDMIRRRGR